MLLPHPPDRPLALDAVTQCTQYLPKVYAHVPKVTLRCVVLCNSCVMMEIELYAKEALDGRMSGKDLWYMDLYGDSHG